MGRRGPLPISREIKQNRGTFRADRADSEPVRGRLLARTPPVPKSFNAGEAEIWRTTARTLIKARVLTDLLTDALEGYCRSFARARDAEAVIAREGRTVKTTQGTGRHPELVTAEKARAEMRAFMMRLARETPAASPDDDDEVARFLFDPRNSHT